MNSNYKKEIFLFDECFKRGIMLITEKDISKALKTLPIEEANKMKRKFRKIWRKLAKKKIKANLEKPSVKLDPIKEAWYNNREKSLNYQFGIGSAFVGKRAKSQRKKIVERKIVRSVDKIINEL